MEYIFFDSWSGIFRVSVTTVIAYLTLIILLRVSGKRTLAKMNAFDFIVTIALGSILGAVILNKNIPLSEGLLAVVLLILLQFSFTYISVRNAKFKNLITSQPTLLFYRGDFFDKILKKERITKDFVNKSARQAGYMSLNEIEAIVLEPTGDITVIGKKSDIENENALSNVSNFPND